MRYFLLDKVTSIEVGQTASGVKCVSLSDDVLHDHFPDYPILPGALLVEGLAQLAGFLLEVSINKEEGEPVKRAMLAQIERAKFHGRVGPGDTVEMTASIHSLHDAAALVDVEARVNTVKVSRGRLSFALLSVDSEPLSKQRQQLYRLWTRELDHCLTFR